MEKGLSIMVSSLLVILCSAAVAAAVAPSGTIQVNSFGVHPVESGDVALVFYANVSHPGGGGDEDGGKAGRSIAARLEMVRCCLKVEGGSGTTDDCESMQVVSGLGVVFRPKESGVLNAYFANLDLFDRNGSCILRVMTKAWKSSGGGKKGQVALTSSEEPWEKGKEITIPFDTTLPQPGLFRKLLISLGGSTAGYRVCHSDNSNAEHECGNRDCQTRYSGARSIFNEKTKTCEPTPRCGGGDSSFQLSTVTGRCEKINDVQRLEESFSPEMKIRTEKRGLGSASGRTSPTTDTKTTSKTMTKLVCEHGELIHGLGGVMNCTCHAGWKSQAPEEEETDGSPSSATFRMCNVPTGGPQELTQKIILGLLIVGLMLPVAAILVLVHRQKWARDSNTSFKNIVEGASDDDESNKGSSEQLDDADAVIAEVANRREAFLSGKASSVRFQEEQDPPPPPAPSSASRGGDNDDEKRDLSKASRHQLQQSPSTPAYFPPPQNQAPFKHPSTFANEATTPAGSLGFIPSPVARRTPSTTDQMLDLNLNERKKAHHHFPLHPTSSSTESITQQKKEEWALYNLQHIQAEEDTLNNNLPQQASKARSVPEMHQTSSSSTTSKVHLPSMNPEDTASRELAYSTLRRMLNDDDIQLKTASGPVASLHPSTSSIWSNVASENAFVPELSPSASRKPSVAELFEANQQQQQFRHQGQTTPSHTRGYIMNKIHSSGLHLESDSIPSDVYNSSATSLAGSVTGDIGEKKGGDFWKGRTSSETLVNVKSERTGGFGGHTTEPWLQKFLTSATPEQGQSTASTGQTSNTITSAYRIKESLDHALKASKSRSATNFF